MIAFLFLLFLGEFLWFGPKTHNQGPVEVTVNQAIP